MLPASRAMAVAWVGLQLLVALPLARAQRGPGTVSLRIISLHYEVHQGCPSRSEFTAALRRRLPQLEVRAERHPGRVRLRVRIERNKQGVEGSVSVERADGVTDTRRIGARDCVKAASALALIATLGLERMLAATPAPVTEAESVGSGEPTPRVPVSPRVARKPEAGRLGLAVGAGWSHAIVGHPLLGVELGGELGLPWFGRAAGLRMGGRLLWDLDTRRRADVWLASGVGELCPIGRVMGLLRLRACVSAEAGWMRVGARSALLARQVGRSWFTLGLGARAGLTLVGLLGLETQARLVAPLTRRRFTLEDPSHPLARSRLVALELGLALGVRLR